MYFLGSGARSLLGSGAKYMRKNNPPGWDAAATAVNAAKQGVGRTIDAIPKGTGFKTFFKTDPELGFSYPRFTGPKKLEQMRQQVRDTPIALYNKDVRKAAAGMSDQPIHSRVTYNPPWDPKGASQIPWIKPLNTPQLPGKPKFEWSPQNNIPSLPSSWAGLAEGPRGYLKGQGHPGVVLIDNAGLPKHMRGHARKGTDKISRDQSSVLGHELWHNFPVGHGGFIEKGLNTLMGSKPRPPVSRQKTYGSDRTFGNKPTPPGSPSGPGYGIPIPKKIEASQSKLHSGGGGGVGENFSRLQGSGSFRDFWNDWVLSPRAQSYKQTSKEAHRQKQLQTLDNLFRVKK